MHVFVKLVQYLVFITIIWEIKSQVAEFEIIIEQITIEFTKILEFCRERSTYSSLLTRELVDTLRTPSATERPRKPCLRGDSSQTANPEHPWLDVSIEP